jgi:hypothetical protein
VREHGSGGVLPTKISKTTPCKETSCRRHDANRILEIGVAFESLRRQKWDGFLCVVPEQTL